MHTNTQRSGTWTAASTRVPAGAGLPGKVSGPAPRPPERGARPSGKAPRSEPGTGSSDGLTIRWFTPRGRAARAELLFELRQEDGTKLGEVVAGLRRPGLPDERIDLRGIDLRGEDLAAARLRGCDLSGADLRGCDLSCAALQGVDLSRADLRGARLRGASLRAARLLGADLRQADLTDAELCGAALDGARLGEARLHRARLWDVDLSRADLIGADLTCALTRAPAALRPTRSTARPPTKGRPPMSEPLRPQERATQRLSAPRSRPAPRPTERVEAAPPPPAPPSQAGPPAQGQVIAHSTVRLRREEQGREAASFDAALAALLGLRGQVERIAVVVEGQERVLFARPVAPVLRARHTA